MLSICVDHVRAFGTISAVIIVTEHVFKAKLFVGRNFTENTLISLESKSIKSLTCTAQLFVFKL
jgi:hypothetical protein